MDSRHLVDPELLAALDGMPAVHPSAETLPAMRSGIAEFRSSAPAAPEITVEEHRIPRPDGSSLRVLLYLPAAASRTGAIIWFHGGGMVMGTADNDEARSRYLAQRNGCIVAAVDYRLAPDHPYPAGLEDGYETLRWLHTAADDLEFRRDRIAVAGESGGGCIAAALALLARDRGELPISAQFLQYPMLDDRTGTAAELDPLPFAGEFVWTADSNRFAWGAVLGGEPGETEVPAHAAPARTEMLADLPPACIVIGNLDLFLGENLRYARNLVKHGVSTELHIYAGAYHGFMIFCPDAKIAKRAEHDFWGAMERHFRAP